MLGGRNIFRFLIFRYLLLGKLIYSFNDHFLTIFQSFIKFKEDGHEFIILLVMIRIILINL